MSERLGQYVLEERVARGGMAEVWRARGPDGKVVCVKRLDPSLRHDVDFIEMFRDEAALVLDLDHENVVKMHELIDNDDELAQVMEYVDGPSLARIRAAVDEVDGFSVGEALQIGVYLSRALHHAHMRTRDGVVGGAHLAIVHRDVSPQNILIDKRGHLKLVDFGIAKAAQRLTRTRAGTLKGKLSYMAPEQARGDPLDHRADQFASGILVWEMLTGRRLFGGRNELLILEQVQKSDPVPPSTVKRGIPRSVDRAVLRALKWHPNERFPDSAAFALALEACLREVGPPNVVDLAPIVARTLSQALDTTAAHAPAARTRVIAPAAPGSSADATADSSTDSSADSAALDVSTTLEVDAPSVARSLPESTGQFFERRFAWSTLAAAGAGVAFVAFVIFGAVWLAERPPPPAPAPPPALYSDVAGAQAALEKYAKALDECTDPCAGRVRKVGKALDKAVEAARLDQCLAACGVPGGGGFRSPSADALDKRLEGAPEHPCRTELLDDLLDKSPISELGRAALTDAVDQCLVIAANADKARAGAKLDEPAWPKRKARTPAVIAAHTAELEKRGQQALAVGEYARAKELLAEALALEPSHVDDHALLGQAFRGMGDPAGAGYHLRLWLHARPDEADRERAVRYLVRYGQQTELKPSAQPSVDERQARVARMLHDAERDPAAALSLLEQASALLPDDMRVLPRLGDAYATAGRSEDARRAYDAALTRSTSAQLTRSLRERIAKLGT